MRYRIALYISLFCIGFLIFANLRPAYAADQVVTDCANYTGPTVDIPITLDEAVANAVATGGGTVTFSCPFGTVITMNFEMFIPINTVTINGGGNVTLDATNANRIAYINPGATLNLQNMVIRNGSNMTGGALRNDGTLSLDGVTVQGSTASEGGAIYNATGRTLTITNSTFTGNQANSGNLYGAAIYNAGSATITNSNFTSNTFSGAGGAIYNVGPLTVNGGSFSNNTTIGSGGAIYNTNALTVNGATFNNNLASTNGGAIYNAGTLTLNGGSFSNNVASAVGGGGAVYNPGTASSQNVTYMNNTCTNTLITDNGGNVRDSISTGCPGSVSLVASAVCIGATLQVTITTGDPTYNVIVNGTTFYPNAGAGTYSVFGPVNFNNVTVEELTGDMQSLNLGNFVCHNALNASMVCVGADLRVSIILGDSNFNITADSGVLVSNVNIGIHTFTGPRNETNVTVTEIGGNTESLNLGDLACDNTLVASAVCMGANLEVNITSGDIPLELTADSGTLQTGFSTGILALTGPLNETNLTLTELGGDGENLNLGDFNCFVSTTLAATAVCNGADLQVTITNGNAPFSISVTDSNGTMDSGGNPLGVYTFTGPDTFSNIGITEDSGDLEVLNLPDVTCTAPVTPPVVPAPVVLSPDTTALGCDVTSVVENAPDNTYCRLLMKDGGVVNYAGAVPQNLINLGVILAVDVYRLQGGQSITDFGGYSQICLAGEGRLFYLDARTSPRTQVELATESVDGFTCGWIPAAGTIVLTQ